MSMFLDTRSRRQFLAVLAASRLIETSINLSENYKVIPKVNGKQTILFCAANLITQYLLSSEKELLNGQIKSFYTHWAQMTPNDRVLQDVWHRMRSDH
jgi:hypothetical protein